MSPYSFNMDISLQSTKRTLLHDSINSKLNKKWNETINCTFVLYTIALSEVAFSLLSVKNVCQPILKFDGYKKRLNDSASLW